MKTLQHCGLALAVALWIPLGACNDIVKVKNPNVIDPGNLSDANGATALRVGALGDFAFAVDGDGGGTEGQTLVSGLLSDEYRNSDTFGTRQEVDQRAIQPANVTLTGVIRHHRRKLLLWRAVPGGGANECTTHCHPRDFQPGRRAVRQGHCELRARQHAALDRCRRQGPCAARPQPACRGGRAARVGAGHLQVRDPSFGRQPARTERHIRVQHRREALVHVRSGRWQRPPVLLGERSAGPLHLPREGHYWAIPHALRTGWRPV